MTRTVWTLFRQQQQCGAQLHARSGASAGKEPRQPGEAPAEAVADRAAQDHEQAGEPARPEAGYPASDIVNRDQDNTPSAPEPRVEWDEVVQPEKQVGEASHDSDLAEGT